MIDNQNIRTYVPNIKKSPKFQHIRILRADINKLLRCCGGRVLFFLTMSSMHDDNGESLCETAKLIASVLDCASERAVLIADDGTVLHMNSSASHFLNTQRNATSSFSHVNDFLQCQNWRTATRCHVVMKDGTTTCSERNIHMQQLDACPCCTRQYYTAYICSKHERVREVLDHAFDPVVTIDCPGIICTANDATMALFGYSEGELVGHNISMLCGGSHA
eukprot:12731409-Ditylum_brightwellii.AAC.1